SSPRAPKSSWLRLRRPRSTARRNRVARSHPRSSLVQPVVVRRSYLPLVVVAWVGAPRDRSRSARAPLDCPGGVTLQLLERGLCRAHAELAGRLDVQLLDDAVLDDHREALAARPHAELARVHLQAESARI